jgi:hypothetical protein
MRGLKVRGISEPRLVIGDGALGDLAALRDAFPGAGPHPGWWMLDRPGRVEHRRARTGREIAEHRRLGGFPPARSNQGRPLNSCASHNTNAHCERVNRGTLQA